MTLTMYRMEDTERVRFKIREDRRREVKCRNRFIPKLSYHISMEPRLERKLRRRRRLRRQKMRDWRETEGGGRRSLVPKSYQ